jgi:hypothetical protein
MGERFTPKPGQEGEMGGVPVAWMEREEDGGLTVGLVDGTVYRGCRPTGKVRLEDAETGEPVPYAAYPGAVVRGVLEIVAGKPMEPEDWPKPEDSP